MKGRILVVDGDANMCQGVSDNLEVEGYVTAQASSAAEAVAQVKKTQFDVILMDYKLTDGTGIGAIRQIRALNSESQILMVTAHANLDTALRAIQESIDDFLTKPVNFDHLKRAIEKSMVKVRLRRDVQRAFTENLDEIVRLRAENQKLLQQKAVADSLRLSEGGRHDVFICHSSKDKAAADAVCSSLESYGISCWIAPRNITPGKDWAEAIMDALGTCRVVVLISSTHSNASSDVRREVKHAAKAGRVIIPLIIEKSDMDKSISYHTVNHQWIDATEPPLSRYIENLAKAIAENLLGTP